MSKNEDPRLQIIITQSLEQNKMNAEKKTEVPAEKKSEAPVEKCVSLDDFVRKYGADGSRKFVDTMRDLIKTDCDAYGNHRAIPGASRKILMLRDALTKEWKLIIRIPKEIAATISLMTKNGHR